MQNLSYLEKENLKSQHKNERDKRVCDRIKAVLLYDEGWSYSQIAHILLLNDETVRKHIQDFQLKRKLKPENELPLELVEQITRRLIDSFQAMGSKKHHVVS